MPYVLESYPQDCPKHGVQSHIKLNLGETVCLHCLTEKIRKHHNLFKDIINTSSIIFSSKGKQTK